MHRNINALLSRLEGVRQSGDGKWLARCPAHKDQTPSLAVRDADGRILIHCFAGCAFEDVIGAVGISAADLMPENDEFKRAYEGVPGFNSHELVRALVHEAHILSIAMGQVLKGVQLDVDDLRRVNEAMTAIWAMDKEVRRGKAY